MTNEEAINYALGMLKDGGNAKFVKIAIDSLNKQIPKKPGTDGVTVISYCPGCNKQLRTYVDEEDTRWLDGTYTRKTLRPAYCEKCGQAIAWK